MTHIFSYSHILNTPALLRLAAVKIHSRMSSATDYETHVGALRIRLGLMVENAIDADGLDAVCQTIVGLLGPDALIECSSMNEYQVAEAILASSAGIGLLTDLRQNWEAKRGLTIIDAGQETDFYDTMTLREWLETLAGEYIDI